jgi:2-polyprenyl-6-methoxyphenol hydroxylase-like FAD-dependent oxidoreductase
MTTLSLNTTTPLTTEQTTCCIVGAGPGGAVLALLLARQGVDVTLLEAHETFDRDFRGDTVHPAILEVLDEIGVVERVLRQPHRKVFGGALPSASGPAPRVDFRLLGTRYPFIAMMRQVDFLESIVAEARQYATFHLYLGAAVQELIEEEGVVRGVRYRAHDGLHDVRAALTVGADGRFSKLRHLANLPAPIATSPANDVLWFRLPRRETDGEGVMGRIKDGRVLVMLDRGSEWQLGYVVVRDSFAQLKAEGLAVLRQHVAGLAPELADRVGGLVDWRQTSYLKVSSDRMPRWFRPGLLLIGDAAHVMLPIGGNGINYAVQDATAAANLLTAPLRTGRLSTAQLAAVQRRREWPTRITQAIVSQLQKQVFQLGRHAATTTPLPLRLVGRSRFLRILVAHYLAFGIAPVHVRRELRRATEPSLRTSKPSSQPVPLAVAG